MSLENLISNYGYLAILIGTFFEGETILVLGGLAAHQSYLELPWVMASAFVGTLLGDQLYFYIGRAKGHDVLEKRPKWKSRAGRVFALLDKHDVAFILAFRFIYGIRTITPFIIGASRYPPPRFLLLNAVSALAWAVVIGGLGYLFGYAVEGIIGDIKQYQLWFFAVVAGIWLLVHFVAWVAAKKKHSSR